MPELGNKPLGGTMLSEDRPDQRVYPRLYLDDGDAGMIPVDIPVGVEFPMMVKARLSSSSFDADGERSVSLEILEAYPDLSEHEQSARTGRMYPSMSGE